MKDMAKFLFPIFSNAAKEPLSKRPLLLALTACVGVWMVVLAFSSMKLLADHYFPYEGEVIRIGKGWTDHVTFEHTFWEHMIIKTPEGKRVDKLISLRKQALLKIDEGDYVVKARGFDNGVHLWRKRLTAGNLASNHQ